MKTKNNFHNILIVDDDISIRYSLSRMLKDNNSYNISEAKSGEDAIGIIKKNIDKIDLVIMDVKMSGISGIETLKEIKKINPKQLIIIMTAFGTTQTAIEAMKYGAFDYILKPFDIPRIFKLIENAININDMMRNSVLLKGETTSQENAQRIIGNSIKMQEVYKLIGQVAENDINVLILGESGTGKELVAKAIYHHSKRKNMPFIPINCAAIPENLLESELFGHEKGAFTDAQTRKIGKFEQCDGGTLFLDEIGDMSLATQAKILRVIQEKEIVRLGGNIPIKTNVRLIAATNKNLEEAIDKKVFREDLFYRLNVVSIKLPQLKDRKEDLPQLSEYFLTRISKELNKHIIGIKADAIDKIKSYDWPGNVRELENAIKRACILCKGAYILPDEIIIKQKEKTNEDHTKSLNTKNTDQLLDDLFNIIYNSSDKKETDFMSTIEKGLIIRALKAADGNQLKASKILGINRNTLRNKIGNFKIQINKDIKLKENN